MVGGADVLGALGAVGDEAAEDQVGAEGNGESDEDAAHAAGLDGEVEGVDGDLVDEDGEVAEHEFCAGAAGHFEADGLGFGGGEASGDQVGDLVLAFGLGRGVDEDEAVPVCAEAKHPAAIGGGVEQREAFTDGVVFDCVGAVVGTADGDCLGFSVLVDLHQAAFPDDSDFEGALAVAVTLAEEAALECSMLFASWVHFGACFEKR